MLHKKVQHWVSCAKEIRVFIDTEAAGCYHDAICDAFSRLGYQVDPVNSQTTASNRRMMLDFSKTADKDLLAVEKAMIANSRLSTKRYADFYEQMQTICRTSHQLVNEVSALKPRFAG